ncbi:unnamed protein product [Effrenium voratum]|uniref:Pentatricopeptide repeat-containing protein, chloroplastic n=1 Tax=Effrenium voratum TaxID=2562239 RepID=A0AA36JBE4_9DINO|nr:unnamed protein product [Effrenium voratum]
MARSLRQALQDCSRKRRWQQAVHLFDSEASNDQVAVNCVIGACAAARQWQQALALASRADAFGAAALLKAVGGRWHLALHVLRQVRAPDVCLFNVAMSTMRRATQWVWALQLLRHLQEAPKLIPDLISFNTAVGACALGTAWQRGLALFARMPCRPDAVTYSSLTAPWPVQLALLWQALKEVQPDTVLFGSAISTLSRSSQWQRALLLFSEMETRCIPMCRRLQPNAITLSAGICACERGSLWQEALQLLAQIQDAGRLDAVACCSALSACGKAQRWQQALALLRQEEVPPNHFIYNAAITAFEKSQHWPLALLLLEEMRRGSSAPDLVSFNAAMEACGASWRHSLAVFRELEKCMQADRLSYNAVLNACRHQNDIGEAIFSSALQAGAFPWLTWRGKHLLDLHDLSPGAAHFAVQWWLREVGYWKNRAPPGLEIITGQGHLRKRWAHGLPLQTAALQSLQELKASAVPAPNPGRLRVIPRARPPPPS